MYTSFWCFLSLSLCLHLFFLCVTKMMRLAELLPVGIPSLSWEDMVVKVYMFVS